MRHELIEIEEYTPWASLSDLFIQLCASLTAQATMGKLYIKTMLKRKCKTTQQQYQLYVDELENNMFFRNNKNM
jgi:hypothetical protein